ncbi:CinA family protein [Allobranchiibius huperziae]|uniref:Nicotinamide-nucleotide amidase n=1 Tax=Allobranchiibius huperziae TaxID=1874116 RepID=A0A853DKK4_9MICO|nr:CinA family protein [Allobranchiibius huperziae]NYJ75220.1 nicotinamide-nucleotide amidase [Allobranchiibius huperziae]
MSVLDPADVVAALRSAGATVGVAESLTGGLVVARLVQVPGASAVVRGGVVAYATDLKHSVLGVDADLLAAGGAVQAEVAEQMATGVRRVLGSTYGLGTTGVAGPTEQDGQPVGRAFVAVAGPEGVQVRQLDLAGNRESVREACTVAVLRLLASGLAPTGRLD